MTRISKILLVPSLVVCVASCGGGNATKPGAAAALNAHPERCGEDGKETTYDLNNEAGQDFASPCAPAGDGDFASTVHVDTTPDGLLVTVTASDDDFEEGTVGTPVAGRDAIVVYPHGPQAKGYEVPLKAIPGGFKGSVLVPFDDLDKLTDEGTKLTINIHDDDHHKGTPEKDMKLQVTVSAGKSCEKVMDEHPQEIRMGAKQTRDLTAEELGKPMASSAFMSGCHLPDSAKAEICAAVMNGKPLGVTVRTLPQSKKVAECIDHAVRKLSFPKSDKLDVVKTTF